MRLEGQEYQETQEEPWQADALQEYLSERADALLFIPQEAHTDALCHERWQQLVDELLEQRSRFAHSFVTFGGSRYFELASGETVRFKAANGVYTRHARQPILKDHFFVEPQERDRMGALLQDEDRTSSGYAALFGEPIQTKSLSVGVHPVELNLPHQEQFHTKVGRLAGDIVVLSGSDLVPDQLCSGIHIGDQITEVTW